MADNKVALIGFQDFDNLGLGYLASMVSVAGFQPVIVDFRRGKREILEELKIQKPFIAGFSIIFQYHIRDFEDLISYLRREGICCHFTAGGQYASLRYREILEHVPALDSIVRFEGEYTFTELARAVYSGTDWRKTDGIVFARNGNVMVNSLRAVETDLDRFPYPLRSPLKEYALGRKFATLLAGRGCVNNCIYCYQREYHRQMSGPYKRVRQPGNVVSEIEYLFAEKECSVFIFQDDDFPVRDGGGRGWIREFCHELKRRGLSDRIMWKISCRPDEIVEDDFVMMKDHGLFLVFLGIEDGTDTGLARLNKRMTISECLHGIDILNRLEIGFDYGFILFQPWTTFSDIRDNLGFLRKVCGDGHSPVTFLKMMPYCGTPIEAELLKAGRLKGGRGFPDYDFPDRSMDNYHAFISETFERWLKDPDGLVNTTKWVRNCFSTFSRYYYTTPLISERQTISTDTVKEFNNWMIDTMEDLIALFEPVKGKPPAPEALNGYRNEIGSRHSYYLDKMKKHMEYILAMAYGQDLYNRGFSTF